MAFAGEWQSPDERSGWLICDGRPLKRLEYQALFKAIETRHGNGSVDPRTGKSITGFEFNLPDFRGRFLRGADLGAGRDRGPRTPAANGTPGNVGTVEEQATARPSVTAFTTDLQGKHNHNNGEYSWLLHNIDSHAQTVNLLGRLIRTGPGWTLKEGDFTEHEPCLIHTAPLVEHTGHTHTITGGGDPETRPVNCTVNWIIKARSHLDESA